MNIRPSYLLIPLLFNLALQSFAQTDSTSSLAEIDRYTLRLSINEEHHLLKGEALLQIHLTKDSVSHLLFDLSSSASAIAAEYTPNKKSGSVEEVRGPQKGGKEVSITLPDSVKRGDTLFVTLSYEISFDTLSTLPSFIGANEIALLPSISDRWWPMLAPSIAGPDDQRAPIALEVTLSNEFKVVSDRRPDSLHVSGEKTAWTFTQSTPARLASCFVLCASKEFSQKVIDGADSASHVFLYYDPDRFSTGLAEAVVRQLRDANTFYSAVTKSKHADLTMVMIGMDGGRAPWYNKEGFIVGRNSPGFTTDDTSTLLSSEMSPWVYKLAENFSIAFPDSLLLLRASWSKYLATKFFLNSWPNNPEMQRHIRLSLLSKTLNFYPGQALGRRPQPGKDDQALFNRGAYTFLMLEYVMGEDGFEAAVDSMARIKGTAVTSIQTFQRLCERAYGSSLDWFFTQWLNETGFPELVLSTEIIQTNRGNYSVSATVSERGNFFMTPVDIVFSNNVRTITRRVFVSKQDQKFEFILPYLPVRGELDPNYYLLRWVPRLRLLAHARTSVDFLVFDHDLVNSEREASVLLQLDPNNLTGWNTLALFSLGKISVLKGDLSKAEEEFRRGSALEASDPTEMYSVLSLVRLGNVLEMEGKRNEAVDLYKLCVTLAERKPALYGIALVEAQKYLSQKFEPSDDFWYGEY